MPKGSHVHRHRSAGGVPSSAPATSPPVRRSPSQWPPCRRYKPARESRPLGERVHRSPAHIRQVGAGSCFVELYSAGSSRTPSASSCRTQPVWQCRTVPSFSGLLAALPCVSRLGLPSATNSLSLAHSGHVCRRTAVTKDAQLLWFNQLDACPGVPQMTTLGSPGALYVLLATGQAGRLR
jgi:hypothetical protein